MVLFRTSGRMKTPEEMKFETSMKEFTKFQISGNTIYIEEPLLKKQNIEFTISRMGSFNIETSV